MKAVAQRSPTLSKDAGPDFKSAAGVSHSESEDDHTALVFPRQVWLSIEERLRRVERRLRSYQCGDDADMIRQLRTAIALAGVAAGNVSLL